MTKKIAPRVGKNTPAVAHDARAEADRFTSEPGDIEWVKPDTETTPAPQPAATPAPVKATSLTEKYRTLIVQHPDWSLKQLEEDLLARGIEIRKSTLGTYRTDTTATIKIAKSLGLWKD